MVPVELLKSQINKSLRGSMTIYSILFHVRVDSKTRTTKQYLEFQTPFLLLRQISISLATVEIGKEEKRVGGRGLGVCAKKYQSLF